MLDTLSRSFCTTAFTYKTPRPHSLLQSSSVAHCPRAFTLHAFTTSFTPRLRPRPAAPPPRPTDTLSHFEPNDNSILDSTYRGRSTNFDELGGLFFFGGLRDEYKL